MSEHPFEGLYGVFADSLPDGWGRLLLDRTLAARGIAAQETGPLERLAFVGTTGMGALIYEPVIENENDSPEQIELDSIAKSMRIVLDGASADVIEELYQLGGSSGGARPKILVGYHPRQKKIIHGTNDLPAGYEHWLIKFPSSGDAADIAAIEYAYYKMALEAGIEMSPSRLFEGKSGRVYFGTKRFDRIGNDRLHLHSAAGLLHDNFRLSNIDYGHLMDAAFRLEKHVGAYEKILRLASFNVLAHNRDDHSKNFSFLMDATGQWKFAPAYDLTFSNSSHGFHSTMIMGESQHPKKEHLLKLAHHFRIKKPETIIGEVEAAIRRWKSIAAKAGVGKASLNRIASVIVPK